MTYRVKDSDNAVNDGHDDGADGMDDGHEGGADGSEDGLNLCVECTKVSC